MQRFHRMSVHVPIGSRHRVTTRIALGFAFLALITSCKTDRIVVPPALKAPIARGSVSVSPGLRGFVSANLSLETQEGWKDLRSPVIPFIALTTNDAAQIPLDVMQRLAHSMIEFPRIGQIKPEQFFTAAHSMVGSEFASTMTDPQADLSAFAAANPVAQQADDLYLTDSAWVMLASASYAEDIGNGTIAQVVLEPISSTNPNGRVHLYLAGREIVTVNPQYQPNNPGKYKYNSNEATYSYQTGAQTSSGSLSTPKDQTPTSWTPNDRELERQLYRDHPRLARLLDSFLPPVAYAQVQPCNTFLRGALIGLIGMAAAGYTENVLGFIASWVGTVNQVHGYARCKENEKNAGGVKTNPPKQQ